MDINQLQKQIKNHQVVVRPINDLLPYARNSRVHEDWQVSQVAASIREFGFTNPVLIDEDGTIIAGHARVMAAMKVGLEQVPCIVLAHLTSAQKKAYVIADNRLALNASWDEDMLRLEIADIRIEDQNFDVAILGFEKKELKDILGDDISNEDKKKAESDKLKTRFEILVQCENEKHQEQLFQQFQEQNIQCVLL